MYNDVSDKVMSIRQQVGRLYEGRVFRWQMGSGFPVRLRSGFPGSSSSETRGKLVLLAGGLRGYVSTAMSQWRIRVPYPTNQPISAWPRIRNRCLAKSRCDAAPTRLCQAEIEGNQAK